MNFKSRVLDDVIFLTASAHLINVCNVTTVKICPMYDVIRLN